MARVTVRIDDKQLEQIKLLKQTSYSFIQEAVKEKLSGIDLQQRLNKLDEFASQSARREEILVLALNNINNHLEKLFTENAKLILVNSDYREQNADVLDKLKEHLNTIRKAVKSD